MPGDWFHIMNRAIARRTMFEQPQDIEFFLERIRETVERGWIEVHCYTVLASHFHLLVRSPSQEMARALHHVQLNYSRYFNRTRRRDGPLVRGRYRSLLVDSAAYRRVLVGYIDANAVAAGIVKRPDDYAFASCHAYVHGGGPPWLSRTMVHNEIRSLTGCTVVDGARYIDVFGRGFTPAQHELVTRRLRSRAVPHVPSQALFHEGSTATSVRFRRRALRADGTKPGTPLAAASAVDEAMTNVHVHPPAHVGASSRGAPWTEVARALMLAELCGLTQLEIASRLAVGRDVVRSLLLRGRKAVAADRSFAEQIGRLEHDATRRTYGTFLRT